MNTFRRLRLLFTVLALSAMGVAQDAKFADGKVRVYVYRYRQAYAKAIRPSLYCDDQDVARVQNGRYLVLALEPGKHEFWSNDTQSRVAIDMKPGQTYYLRIDLATGLLKAHGRLTMMLPEQGESEYRQLKPIDKDMVKSGALLASEFLPE